MLSFVHDLHQALRGFAREPKPNLILILTLSVGLGGALVVFDLVNLFAWRRPAVARPDELIEIYTGSSQPFYGAYGATSYADYRDYRDASGSFIGLAAAAQVAGALSSSERVAGWNVSGNYFDVLGVEAALGRLLTPGDDRPGAAPVAVLAFTLWQRLHDGDPAAIGSTLRLDGHDFTVVGVAPRGFAGTTQTGERVDLWLPFEAGLELYTDRLDWREDRNLGRFAVIGRLRPGVSTAAARSELTVLARRLDGEHPLPLLRRQLAVAPLRLTHPVDRRNAGPIIRLLLAATALLLVIACANAANLLLSRAVSRTHEMGVRRALGAGNARLARQLLTESFVVAISAGLLGLLLAYLARSLTAVAIGDDFAAGLRFDHRVLGLGLLTCVVTTLLFGLAPVLLDLRTDVVAAIRTGRDTGTRRGGRLGRLLASGQVALATLLLIATGLLTRSLFELQTAELGFPPERLLYAAVRADPERYSRDVGKAFFHQLAERTASLTGVEHAGLALLAPPVYVDASYSFELPEAPGELRSSRFNYVDGGYFAALGLPLVRGRVFDRRDDADARPVVVVNQALAEQPWPGEDPLGRSLRAEERRPWEPGPDYEVVGVVGSSAQHEVRRGAEPILYFSCYQRYRPNLELVLRLAGDPALILAGWRAELRSLDPEIVARVRSFDEHRRSSLILHWLQTQALGLFALLGWLLAVIGVAGVMSYAVSRQLREIAIRMALGASRGDELRRVLGQGMRLTVLGLALGCLLSFPASRLLRHFLFDVGPVDPLVLRAVALVVVAPAAAAVYLPARRAARLDPVACLRQE